MQLQGLGDQILDTATLRARRNVNDCTPEAFDAARNGAQTSANGFDSRFPRSSPRLGGVADPSRV
jgi:hypothetical protein